MKQSKLKAPMEPDDQTNQSDEFWASYIWELTSCDEAQGAFPHALECPVCGAIAVEIADGEYLLKHKSKSILIN